MASNQYTSGPVEERFLARVKKTLSCWLWTGAIYGNGYGAIRNNGRQLNAHRLSYEIYRGPIPDGMCVLHTCDVRSCVNPDHLFLGTHKDNALDRQQKGRGNAQKGECAGHAKLTEIQVKAIKSDRRVMRVIAAEYGVHLQQVYRIKHGLRWAHVI